MSSGVRPEGVQSLAVQARKTGRLPRSPVTRPRGSAFHAVAAAEAAKPEKWRSRHSALRRYAPSSDPWRRPPATAEEPAEASEAVAAPCVDHGYAARALATYQALQEAVEAARQASVQVTPAATATTLPGPLAEADAATKRRWQRQRDTVLERRFRNRMARTHAVRRLDGDTQQWENDKRAREAAFFGQPEYSAEEEVELAKLQVQGGRGQRLYSGRCLAPELGARPRAVTAGELGSTGLSRQAGSGCFPSPIAHAARLEVDPGWMSVQALIPAEHRGCVQLTVFPNNGKLWGKCTLCKKFWDEGHHESRWHVDKAKKLGLVAGVGAQSDSSNRSVPVPEPVPRALSHVPSPSGKRKYGVQVVYPDGYEQDAASFGSQPVHGAFLIDSFSEFSEMVDGKWKQDQYVGRMLKEVWRATGWVFMAVYKGGAALVAERGSVTFAQLLEVVPSGVDVVIAVIMGNDFYSGGKALPWDSTVDRAVCDFSSQLQARARKSFVLLGASAATWQYERFMPPDQLRLYDQSVQRGSTRFWECGVDASTGAAELPGLKPVDKIGHLGVCNAPTVFAAYVTWVTQACGTRPTPSMQAAVSDSDFFDLLAELPQGPRKFTKNSPEAPTCVYEASSGGRVYVGGFAGAEDRYGLRNAHVGLVVSVLGRDQKHPVVPKGIRHFRFNCDCFEDRTQWCELVEAMMEELDAGRSVLVHCMAGVHRAPMCAAGALAVLLGISLGDAYGYVLASGRYVDPHTFEHRMRRRCGMEAIVRVLSEVRVAMRSAAVTPEPVKAATASTSSSVTTGSTAAQSEDLQSPEQWLEPVVPGPAADASPAASPTSTTQLVECTSGAGASGQASSGACVKPPTAPAPWVAVWSSEVNAYVYQNGATGCVLSQDWRIHWCSEQKACFYECVATQ